MDIYIYFFFIVILFTFLGSELFGKTNIKAIVVPIIIMILFAGLRGNVGTDTFAYKSFFNSFGTDRLNLFTFEPLFVLYTLVINLIWSNDQFYIFIISVTTGILLYYNLKLVEEKALFLVFYLATYYVMFNLNLMRFGLGVLLISYPYLKSLQGEKFKPVFLLLGFTTHFATLFTMVFVLQKKYLIRTMILLGVFFFLFGNLLLNKFKTYFIFAFLSMGKLQLDFGLWLEIGILLLLFWINRKNIGKQMILLLVAYIILRNLTFVFEMLQRFAYLSGVLIYLNFFHKRQNLYTRMLVILLITFNFYRSIMFIHNSDNLMNDLMATYPGFNTLYSQTRWVPFKFFWQQ